VDVVNPGFCHSSLTREASGTKWLFMKLLKLALARTTEEGSRTLVHAALAGTQSEMQGRYLNACRVEEESDYAISEEGSKVEEKVWVRHFVLCMSP